jgi:hypothetical protein
MKADLVIPEKYKHAEEYTTYNDSSIDRNIGE